MESQSLEESPALLSLQPDPAAAAAFFHSFEVGSFAYMSSQIWEMETGLVQEAGGLVASLCPVANSQYGCAQSLPHLRTQFSPHKNTSELLLIPLDPAQLPPLCEPSPDSLR